MRYVYLTFILIVVAVVSVLGFRGTKFTKPPIEVFDDMDHMPKYQPQAESAFFADGRVDRLPVPNTVARGTFIENEFMATGKVDGAFANGFPIAVDNAAMERGQERYNIYCTVCHGATGDGAGRTADYGMTAIANLTAAPYTDMKDGEIFHYIGHGSRSGRMYGYKEKLSVEDRWKVVLYVRALQRAANGSVNDLTPATKEELGL
ncbi:c-type cytochrome [Pelagicoccus sp. SDUM812003]|uniref:c-type cytochrome n=1 Tax=Pelagicoccus sp. SDUM812003 TaxID=3041267 RepID=UPI00280CC629|nr:c-type cytochrome [Pelagicoccus sp. SDUM812003]MDQ8202977.1 c-type cytochrome [Pelagicoccus sp. SDUM812003]